jgi:hypothetical protein
LRRVEGKSSRLAVACCLLALAAVLAVSAGYFLPDRSAWREQRASDVRAALQDVDTFRTQAHTLADNPSQWDATLAAARSSFKRAEALAVRSAHRHCACGRSAGAGRPGLWPRSSCYCCSRAGHGEVKADQHFLPVAHRGILRCCPTSWPILPLTASTSPVRIPQNGCSRTPSTRLPHLDEGARHVDLPQQAGGRKVACMLADSSKSVFVHLALVPLLKDHGRRDLVGLLPARDQAESDG